jgi:hypothetical protein
MLMGFGRICGGDERGREEIAVTCVHVALVNEGRKLVESGELQI